MSAAEPIPELLTEAQAAKRLSLKSKDALRRERYAGRIAFVRVRGTIRYTPDQLAEYIRCQTVPAKSATTGSASAPTARSGVGRGSTLPPDRRDGLALAQEILRKRRAG